MADRSARIEFAPTARRSSSKPPARMQMVLTGAETVASYDPDTGKQIWEVTGPTEQFVASMVYGKGLFFLTAGFPTYHVMGIKPDGTGNVTKTHVAWHVKNGGAGYVPSPVVHGDELFLVHDAGPRHLPRRADRKAPLGPTARQAPQRVAGLRRRPALLQRRRRQHVRGEGGQEVRADREEPDRGGVLRLAGVLEGADLPAGLQAPVLYRGQALPVLSRRIRVRLVVHRLPRTLWVSPSMPSPENLPSNSQYLSFIS